MVIEERDTLSSEEMSLPRRWLEWLFASKRNLVRNLTTILLGIVAVIIGNKTFAAFYLLMIFILAVSRVYLWIANSRLFKKFFRPRRIRLTAEGWWFIILTIGIGTAAINTGSNLLYLVLSMMLSFIVISGILSEIGFRGIDATRTLPNSVFAGEEFEVEVSVRNKKRFNSSFSLLIDDSPESAEILKRRSNYNFIPRIPPRSKALISYAAAILRRGVFTFNKFRVSSRFPFHFFNKTVTIKEAQNLLVYPHIYKLNESKILSRRERSDALRKSSLPALGEEDFRGVKEYRDGDNPHRIHWPLSARHRKLIVKEFEKQRANRAYILLNTYQQIRDEKYIKEFEKSVSTAASLVSFFYEKNYSICFAAYTPALVRKKSATGKHHFYNILETLARLKFSDKTLIELVSRLDPHELTNSLIFIVSVKLSPKDGKAIKKLRKYSPFIRVVQVESKDFPGYLQAKAE
ncbi:MAG: DUF58 domain-containing protein [Planctomycetota bacterium]